MAYPQFYCPNCHSKVDPVGGFDAEEQKVTDGKLVEDHGPVNAFKCTDRDCGIKFYLNLRQFIL